MRRHEFYSRSTPEEGKLPPPPPGSPAYIKAHPPPPLCIADSKLNVYIDKDNRRTFTTSGGYFSEEATKNKVRCKGSLPSEKCLAFELRKDKADADNAPAPVFLLARKSGSLRSIMMDAVEGPIPKNQVPMEASISGFGGHQDFSAQPPKPALKPVEVTKPQVVANRSQAGQASPVHPAAQKIQAPKPKHPVPSHSGPPTPGATPPNSDFINHMSNPCSAVSHKQCPCVQDNDLPLLFTPHQYVVDKVGDVSLAVPEQKDRDLHKDPLHILVIGVGSGSLSMSVLNNCRVFVPGGLKVESVEPDQTTMTVAQQLFGFKAIDGVHKTEVNHCGDALQSRMKDGNAANGGKYDVVILNVMNGDDIVPSGCKNQTFLGQVKTLVKNQGVVMNIVGKQQLKETMTDYTAIWGNLVRSDPVHAPEGPTNYHVIFAGDLNLAKSSAGLPYFSGLIVILLASLSWFDSKN